MRLLLVEDTQALAHTLALGLEEHGTGRYYGPGAHL